MREFVTGEEDFSLKWIEKVPEPAQGECFLLCQEGAGMDMSMIISRGAKYSATAVRHKHLNKKIVFELQKKAFQKNYQIVMADYDFNFLVDVSISYEIQDVKKYYFGNIMEENTLRNLTRKSVNRQNKMWRLKEECELQRELESEIEREVQQFEGVRFQVNVDVSLDEGAKEIKASDQRAAVAIHASGKDMEIRIAENENNAAIAESQRMLKAKQIEEIRALMNDFGILGPIANEYLEGKLSGVEFYNYIVKVRTDDMNLLNMAVKNDLLSMEDFMARVDDILSNRRYGNIEAHQLSGSDRGKLEVHSCEKEEAADDVDDVEQEEAEAVAEGGFV